MASPAPLLGGTRGNYGTCKGVPDRKDYFLPKPATTTETTMKIAAAVALTAVSPTAALSVIATQDLASENSIIKQAGEKLGEMGSKLTSAFKKAVAPNQFKRLD